MDRGRHLESKPSAADWALLSSLVFLALAIPALIVARHLFGLGAAAVDPVRWYVAVAVAGLAFLICSANFYLSFLRPWMYVWRRRNPDDYRRVSGIPLLGNVLIGVAALALPSSVTSGALLLVFLAIDTGAIHWAVWALLRDLWGPPPAAPHS